MGKRVMSQQVIKTTNLKPKIKKKNSKNATSKGNHKKRPTKNKSYKSERTKEFKRYETIIKTESRASLSRGESPETFKKKEFPLCNLDTQHMCDTTEDTYPNYAGRLSNCSIPLTETSKKMLSSKESQNNIDMPLQRNFSDLNCQEVAPILEDSKGEETVIGEIETFPSSEKKNKTSQRFTRIKKVKSVKRKDIPQDQGTCMQAKRVHSESIKPYKAPDIVEELTK